MDIKIEIGSRIKKLREAKGLSQTQLGKMLGRSHAAVSDIERGKTELTVSDLLKIAQYLQTPINFILNIQGDNNYTFQIQGNNIEFTNSKDLKLNLSNNNTPEDKQFITNNK